jgi:hypothetical protein
MTITEQFILMTAPNAAAAANGRKLSREGRFSDHGCSSEGNVFWANCAGSGKNGYRTSVDFTGGEGKTVCRCSCPSRQFPCKHGVGLLYEILAGKQFPVGAMPEDLARKLEKQAAKAEKTEKEKASGEKTKKTNTAAQKKKILKQLEGLDLVEKLIDDLLTAGMGTLAGTSAAAYLKIAQDLGNYYLTGPQNAFTRMALEIRKIQKDWLSKIDDKSRESFVNSLFSLFEATGMGTFGAMSDSKLKSAESIISAIQGMPKDKQKEMKQIAAKLLESSRQAVFDSIEEKLKDNI